jgi:hypothetical protein
MYIIPLIFIGGCWVLLSIPRLFLWLFSIDPLNAPPRLAVKAGERPAVRWEKTEKENL